MTLGNPSQGMVVLQSARAPDDVIARLRQILTAHNLRIFADLNFSADAAAAGLTLRPTRMLVAGNPKAGTLLIQAVPAAAIDLPLKVLVWAEDGGTRVAYNDPEYLGHRHGLSADLLLNISGFGTLVENAAGP
ncbi:MAG TPA: DUF302 domain-containing protein [Steroidobacteraceae bacterium]|nr:DUF302 domain-containing protein [Steroidobacteraceae bacterium]